MPLTLASFTYNAAWNIGNARGNVGKYWQKLWMQKQWWIWVYISFSQIVSLAYYCYWHRKSPNLPPPWEMMAAASEKKLFNVFNVKFIFFVDNLKFIGLSDVSGRDTPSWSSLSNKLLGGRQPNTTLRESSKFWRLKNVDSKLCLNWRVWNEIPVSTVLCWQNGKYVLIPICDHYHYIKLQLSTPTTGSQKRRV